MSSASSTPATMDSIKPVVESLCESMRSGSLVDDTLIENSENGISLLALKNDALLSYINNLLLVAAAQLEQNEDLFKAARRRSIEQRVTLEKGIKGLEAKISYQVDKALRAYRKSVEQAEKREAEAQNDAVGDEQDSDSDVDPTAFRPNVANLRSRSHKAQDSDESDDDRKKYVAPKISATAPSFEKEKKRAAPRRRDYAMEEYIRETGDAPIAEASIGSQIMDGGRGGQRTARDRRKDKEIQEYEESNFTRISDVSSKQARKDAFKRQQEATTKSFFGEDWNFLDNDSRDSGKRSKKRRKN